MSVLRNLQVTDEEAILAAADDELEELSDSSRPMLTNEITKA